MQSILNQASFEQIKLQTLKRGRETDNSQRERESNYVLQKEIQTHTSRVKGLYMRVIPGSALDIMAVGKQEECIGTISSTVEF